VKERVARKIRGGDPATPKVSEGGNYFASQPKGVEFFSSGCTVLDLALGGGWAEGRYANIVGDKSSGKTLLCIEACANFAIKHPKGKIYYRESEAAFDNQYAEALGMPIDRVEFSEEPLDTVEDLFEDLSAILKGAGKNPILYICDSLDALSDRAEMERAIDKGSYGGSKPKKIGELFRRLVRLAKTKNLTLIIVSQVRDKIGVMFGDKQTRTGGRALDFYASQILWLSQLKKLVKTKGKVKRTTGVLVKGQLKKNKVSLPFREAEFPIKFGYGIDDQAAMTDWLESIGAKDTSNNLQELRALVIQKWYQIEDGFLPKNKKYG
jgi:recombination protein RecA